MAFIPDAPATARKRSSFVPDEGTYRKDLTNEQYLMGTAKNILPSAGKTAMAMGSGILNMANPNIDDNTLAQTARLAYGGLQKLDPTEGKFISKTIAEQTPIKYVTMADKARGMSTDYQPQADAVGKFYKDRYGGIENIKKSFYEDPTGVALDAATVATGVGGALKGAGTLANSSRLVRAGQVASKVGRAIDPVSIAGKAGSAVARPVINRVKPLLRGVGEDLSVRALQPSKSQLTKFEEVTDIPFKDYVKSEGITGDAQTAFNQIKAKIRPLQNKYNRMARTGKQIEVKKYTDALRKQAIDILEKDRSAPARSVAEKLWEEADIQDGIGNMTDTVLTNTKSSQFSKVPGGVMSDPIAANFSKESGIAGVKALEELSKGSSALGRKLMLAREFEDIVKNQSNLSKGTQIFNTVKPAFAGFMTGAASGSFIPGVGNIAGGLAGAGSAIALNNPKVMSMLGQYLQKAGKASTKTKVAKSNIFKDIIKTGKVTRMANPL